MQNPESSRVAASHGTASGDETSSSPIVSIRDARVLASVFDGASSKETNTEESKQLLAVDKLEIFPGELISITGESGAGKTMLLRLLCDTAAPGTVIEGDIEVPAKTSLIMQDSLGALNPLVRCDKQVRLMCSRENSASSDSSVAKAFEACGVDAKLAHRYPLQLSGGQRQRVAIAGALASRPQLLLADEPTSALDPIATLSVVDALKALHRATNAAVVVSTHDLGVARKLCTRHLRVEDGKVYETAMVAPFAPRTEQHENLESHSGVLL